MSSPTASYDSTLGSTKMPTPKATSTPKPIVTKSMTPKLTKMYQDYIDPMTEYELAQSMNRTSNSVSNASRRPLESLDISSRSAMNFYENYSHSNSPTSVQSWPMDNFTHQSRRHHYVAEPAYHFSEFDSFASTHTLFQNQENENDVEMQSPVIQRLLNEQNDEGFFPTFSTFSM